MDTDMYEANERYRRTFQMTESKRRLAEYPFTPAQAYQPSTRSYSFTSDRVMAMAWALQIERLLHQYVPKPEKTDRLLEYKQIPEDRLHEWNEAEYDENGELTTSWYGNKYLGPDPLFKNYRMVVMDFSKD